MMIAMHQHKLIQRLGGHPCVCGNSGPKCQWICLASRFVGSVRFGSVRFGSVRFGSVRFGSVRLSAENNIFVSVPADSACIAGGLTVIYPYPYPYPYP